MKHTIIKNGVRFEIEQQADKYGQLDVVATVGDQRERGTIPGTLVTAYPRIEFKFCSRAQWLHKLADKKSWSVDDYETDAEMEKRPTDNCEFVLSAGEVAFLNSWRITQSKPVQVVAQQYQSMDISSGLGIGGVGSDDFNINTEYDKPVNFRPTKCGNGQRYDEQCSGCGSITVICNDCELCEKCHG